MNAPQPDMESMLGQQYDALLGRASTGTSLERHQAKQRLGANPPADFRSVLRSVLDQDSWQAGLASLGEDIFLHGRMDGKLVVSEQGLEVPELIVETSFLGAKQAAEQARVHLMSPEEYRRLPNVLAYAVYLEGGDGTAYIARGKNRMLPIRREFHDVTRPKVGTLWVVRAKLSA